MRREEHRDRVVYSQDELQATGAVRTLPNNEFTLSRVLPLTQGWFHTFASGAAPTTSRSLVVRRQRSSCTPRTPTEAHSNVRNEPQFQDAGGRGHIEWPTWMKMDWVRNYTLENPNVLPIERATGVGPWSVHQHLLNMD